MAALLFRWAERVIYYGHALFSFPEIFNEFLPSIHTGHPLVLIPLMLLELVAISTLIHARLYKFSWIILYATNLTLAYETSIVGKGTKLLFPLLIIFGIMFHDSRKKNKVPVSYIQGLVLFISLMYFFSGINKLQSFSVYQFFNSSMSSMPEYLSSFLNKHDRELSFLTMAFECLGILLFPASLSKQGSRFIHGYKWVAVLFHVIIFFFTPLKFFSLLCLIPWFLIRKGESQSILINLRKSFIIFILTFLTSLNNLWPAQGHFFSHIGLGLRWNLVPQTQQRITSEVFRNDQSAYRSEDQDSLFWYYYLTDAYRYPKKFQALKIKFCQTPEDTISLYYRRGSQIERSWIQTCSP